MEVGAVKDDTSRVDAPFETVRARIAWLVTSLAGGLLAGVIVSLFAAAPSARLMLIYFVPLIVAVGHVIGAQSLVTPDRGDPALVRQEIARQLLVGAIV